MNTSENKLTSRTEDNKRLANNTLALYLRSFIVLVVGLYTSRVILQALGVSDYGIYSVVGSVVVFFSFFNSAMTASIQRFLTFEIGRNDINKTRKVFSVSMASQISLAIILVMLMEVVGVWFLNTKLNIPDGRMTVANWVFQISIVTFIINMIVIPYTASIVANEKMAFFAYVSIIDAVLRLGIVLFVKYASCDRLVLYAVLLSIESLVVFFINRNYCKRKFVICTFSLVRDSTLYKKLFSYIGWSLLGSSSDVATRSGFTFILNIFYGVTLNAALGIANRVNSAITNFVNSFQTSYRPQIVKTYAEDDLPHLTRLIISASKMSYALMVVPILLLIINMPLVLKIWLGDVPDYAEQFCQIMLICTLVDAVTGPYNAAIMATTNIKRYEIAISLSFLLDLFVSYILMKYGISPTVVLLSRLFTRGGLNMFIGWFFLKKFFSFPLKKYIRECIIPILTISIITIPLLIFLYLRLDGWQLALASLLLILVLYYLLVMNILFTKSERAYVKDIARTMINKYTKRRYGNGTIN